MFYRDIINFSLGAGRNVNETTGDYIARNKKESNKAVVASVMVRKGSCFNQA